MKKENLIKKLKKLGCTLDNKNTFIIDTIEGKEKVEVLFNGGNDVVSAYMIEHTNGSSPTFIYAFSFFKSLANDLVRYKNNQ